MNQHEPQTNESNLVKNQSIDPTHIIDAKKGGKPTLRELMRQHGITSQAISAMAGIDRDDVLQVWLGKSGRFTESTVNEIIAALNHLANTTYSLDDIAIDWPK